ncbi:MAG: hypothetical protein QNJ46_08750 [Leptolyngbyaceae cyanobacterium MO_188.B28]|nr:hypothetical protein [Leptolyngbyaceae cyanobacterium MO_188.B28]
MDSHDSKELKVCPICKISITEDGQVKFSTGSPGTRARLYARVCQFARKPGCINQDTELIGELARGDGFETGEELVKQMTFANPSRESN